MKPDPEDHHPPHPLATLPISESAMLAQLDRLEELIEDLDELGIASRDEAEARRIALHRALDALEDRR